MLQFFIFGSFHTSIRIKATRVTSIPFFFCLKWHVFWCQSVRNIFITKYKEKKDCTTLETALLNNEVSHWFQNKFNLQNLDCFSVFCMYVLKRITVWTLVCWPLTCPHCELCWIFKRPKYLYYIFFAMRIVRNGFV